MKPPRLDGSKTGLFATRSPHRPNPIGLSLTKLDKVEGDLIYVSGLDILDGTPVLDIKPYISDYDYPKMICELNLQVPNSKPNWISCKGVEPKKREILVASRSKPPTIELNELVQLDEAGEVRLVGESKSNEVVIEVNLSGKSESELKSTGKEDGDLMELDEAMKTLEISQSSQTSSSQLEVLFTARSEAQLRLFHCKDSDEHNEQHLIKDPTQVKNFYLTHSFLNQDKRRAAQTNQKLGGQLESQASGQLNGPASGQLDGHLDDQLDDRTDERTATEASGESARDGQTKANSSGDPVSSSLKCKYCLEFLSDAEKAKRALINTLVHDPRSAYRRSRGTDKLYYFTLDTMHITAWFDEEDRTVEVVKIKPNYL